MNTLELFDGRSLLIKRASCAVVCRTAQRNQTSSVILNSVAGRSLPDGVARKKIFLPAAWRCLASKLGHWGALCGKVAIAREFPPCLPLAQRRSGAPLQPKTVTSEISA